MAHLNRATPLSRVGFGRSAIVADGVVLTDTALDAARRGDLDGIPVLLSSNGTEATLFTIGTAEPTDDELLTWFAEFSNQPEDLLALYQADRYESNLERYRTMLTDLQFACRNWTYAEASTGTTYVVAYDYTSPNDPFGVGPTHGAELIPLFAHPEGIIGLSPGWPESEPEAEVLSDAMQEAWVSFATTGDPGELFVPYGDGRRVTVLDDPITVVDDFRGGRCDDVRALAPL